MTVSQFISRHNLQLSPKDFAACEAGVKIMSESVDPFHNRDHVYRILHDLHRFIVEDASINWEKIDLTALLISVCWHDTWQSQRHPKGRRSGYYQRFMEGIGSMRLFGNYASQHHLDKKTARSVKYIIRKHSIFQIFPRFTKESLILVDLDKLEGWSLDRLRFAIKTPGTFVEVTPKIIKVYRLYLRLWMFRSWGNHYRFNWAKKQYEARRQVFINEVGNILKEIGKGIFNPNLQLHLSSEKETATNYPKTEESS